MKPLEAVEVFEMPPVIDKVISARHFGDFVNRKAGHLIKRDAKIDQRQRIHQGVNDRPGENVLRPVGDDPVKNAPLYLAMRRADGTLESDTHAVKVRFHRGHLSVNHALAFRLVSAQGW